MQAPIITLDEETLKGELKGPVRKTVEESVDEALVEMYLLGVSIRSMEDVTKLLCDEGVSAGAVSNLD